MRYLRLTFAFLGLLLLVASAQIACGDDSSSGDARPDCVQVITSCDCMCAGQKLKVTEYSESKNTCPDHEGTACCPPPPPYSQENPGCSPPADGGPIPVYENCVAFYHGCDF